MFDFFQELEDFFNSFIEYIQRFEAVNSSAWQQFSDSEIFKFLMRYQRSFPQYISWGIYIVIFTTFLDFVRKR